MFGVFSFTLTHFLAKTIFPEGMGVYKIAVEIPEGWGVILVGQKWKFRGGGGVLREIPSVVGVWIFSGTTQWEMFLCLAYIGNEIYIDELDVRHFCEHCMKSYVNGNFTCKIELTTRSVSDHVYVSFLKSR